MKHYMGFAILLEEKEDNNFSKEVKEVLCRIRVYANNFAEAQETVCKEMQLRKTPIVFVFPYTGSEKNEKAYIYE